MIFLELRKISLSTRFGSSDLPIFLIFVMLEFLNHVDLGSSLEHDGDDSESNTDWDTEDFVGEIPAVISSQLNPESFITL